MNVKQLYEKVRWYGDEPDLAQQKENLYSFDDWAVAGMLDYGDDLPGADDGRFFSMVSTALDAYMFEHSWSFSDLYSPGEVTEPERTLNQMVAMEVLRCWWYAAKMLSGELFSYPNIHPHAFTLFIVHATKAKGLQEVRRRTSGGLSRTALRHHSDQLDTACFDIAKAADARVYGWLDQRLKDLTS